MNRIEFLKELDRRLKLIPEEDRFDAISYYDEYIGDSGLGDDADVVGLLGTPKDVANKIIADCSVKHADEQKEKKTVKGGATTAWLVILGILTLPISLPIAIVVLVLMITAVIVVLAIGLGGVAVFVAGIVSVIAAFFTVTVGVAGTVVMIGRGLAAAGIAMFVVLGAYMLGKALIRGMAKLLSQRN